MTGNTAEYPDQTTGLPAENAAHAELFWSAQGQRLDWFKPFTQVRDVSYDPADVHIRWFYDGVLNAAYNCLDRHLAERGEQIAIIWEGDDPSEQQTITYRELHRQVCQCANVLKALGVQKGDRVAIYLPMIPQVVVAMLACARIGAIHSVVFAGFSANALAGRIRDSGASILITADEGIRGGRHIPLKTYAEEALEMSDSVRYCLVVKRSGAPVIWNETRDRWFHEQLAAASADCPAEPVEAEHPLFILYTSGSTGKPKGVLHTTGGYLVAVALSHQTVFDYRPGEVYWCTADIGWVTGHSYIVYGPLANGATTLIYEGVPHYPDESRFWTICDKHRVNIFYTAPTAIRALMRAGEGPVRKTRRDSLRVLGSVGEPINPQAWEWYYRIIGDQRCPVIDTWWQTETGAIMIAPLASQTPRKPGSATRPLCGVQVVLVDENGHEITGAGVGNLCLRDGGPGMLRTLYGDHQRFVQTYFTPYPGLYFSGDRAQRDADGDYWISGRIDDVINVAGHRLGTAEIESALVAHPDVAEAAVVGYPHDLKGQGIYAYVTLMQATGPSDRLSRELVQWVRKTIGPVAAPDHIQFALVLPKTRSGKIMRRILRKIAAGEFVQLGDTSTLADPAAVDNLVQIRRRCDTATAVSR